MLPALVLDEARAWEMALAMLAPALVLRGW